MVPCVHNQIEQNLFQLTRVSLNLAQIVVKVKRDSDVFANQSFEHPVNVRNHAIQFKYDRRKGATRLKKESDGSWKGKRCDCKRVSQ